MFISKRKNRHGEYYSFSYDDPKTKKRIRLKKSQHPHFTDEASAKQWARSQDALFQSQQDRIAKKMAWKNEFYEFEDLINKYTVIHKVQAPNSWRGSVYYLTHYVLPWFLNTKKQNNINGWHFLFNDFRTWLSTEAKTLSGKKLTYSSCNKAIHSLNSFLEYLKQNGLIDPDAARKCTAYPDAMLNQKTFEAVISEAEFKHIHTKLIEIHEPTADFWWVLYHTGLRFNELFSLPMSSLFRGHTDGTMHDELTKLNITYVGYLVLESQAEDRFRARGKDGSIKRKPLKGRRKIHPKNNRIIPISDKECWNILARRFSKQKASLEAKKYGMDPVNYILFDDIKLSKALRSLNIAYDTSGYNRKTFHDCRHSYCTYMVGRTRSFFLVRTVLGHKSNAFERYLHIFEQMALKAKQNQQVIEEIM